MTERKYNKYTLWVKWKNRGWCPAVTCLDLPWPADNPIRVLKRWARTSYMSAWDKSEWMILGGDKKPSGLKDRK